MELSIPISALQHYAFCPRQCALIHIEQRWSNNHLTASGNQLHARVHSDQSETRKNVRTERGVRVQHLSLGIHGQLDLLEIHSNPLHYIPVEYKNGKPKLSDHDRVQLCAQALCIEHMTQTRIERAALWYWQPRKREWIDIDNALRALTRRLIRETRVLFQNQVTPPGTYKKYCKSCSLYDECQPKISDSTGRYIRTLFDS